MGRVLKHQVGEGLIEARLTPAPAAAAAADEPAPPRQPPAAWCAQALVQPVREAGDDGLVYVASSERRADEIGRALRQFTPDAEVLVLEPWDCLPYDRASPSRDVMGRRMAVLARLAEQGSRPFVLVAAVEALLQRTPPPRALRRAFLELARGRRLDRDRLAAFARSTGYVFDDRVDEPGEIAVLGGVVDIFPAAANAPVRLLLDETDQILEIRRFDPLSQRTDEEIEHLQIGPASELILVAEESDRTLGAEHRAPETYGKMPCALDRCPKAALVLDPLAEARATDFLDQIAEAYEGRLMLGSGPTRLRGRT